MKCLDQRRFLRLIARKLLLIRCETRVRGAFRLELVKNLAPSRWGNADPGAASYTPLFATSVNKFPHPQALTGGRGQRGTEPR